jgi:hypothetical protein
VEFPLVRAIRNRAQPGNRSVGASAVGCGSHDEMSNLLKPSEKASIAAWQIEDLPENPGEDPRSSK